MQTFARARSHQLTHNCSYTQCTQRISTPLYAYMYYNTLCVDVAVVTPFVDYVRNFQCRLSFTFQITLSSRLIAVQKLWLLLCSIISHDFRLLQCMTAAQQMIRILPKRMNGKEQTKSICSQRWRTTSEKRIENQTSILFIEVIPLRASAQKLKMRKISHFVLALKVFVTLVSINDFVKVCCLCCAVFSISLHLPSSCRNEGGADKNC